MKRSLLALPIALAFAAPAAAQDPPSGLVVSGPLTKQDAHDFILKQLPDEAPQLLLKDERADWYTTSSTRVQKAKNCLRIDRSQVRCNFWVRLKADKAHRVKGWFPIKCHGRVQAARLSDGGIGGDTKNYKCVTVLPKKSSGQG